MGLPYPATFEGGFLCTNRATTFTVGNTLYSTSHPISSIDYRCAGERKYELRGNIGVIKSVLTPSFIKYFSSPSKNEPFSQETHSEKPRSSIGLKLSNPEPGCIEALFHELVKQIPPTDFWNQVDSDM
jgi:hypothetical protein